MDLTFSRHFILGWVPLVFLLGVFGNGLKDLMAKPMIRPPFTNQNGDSKELRVSSEKDELIPRVPANSFPEALGCNQFGLDLFSHLEAQDKGNLIFSPFSIHTCFSMVYAGAEGETAVEMEKLFKFVHQSHRLTPGTKTYLAQFPKPGSKGDGDKPYQFRMANGIWVSEKFPLNPKYSKLIQTVFSGEISNCDFLKQADEVKETINKWVSEVTNGKIPSLLDSLNPSSVMVLVNAIYFQGDWAKPFDKEKTEKLPFYPSEKDKVEVETLRDTRSCSYFENGQLQAVSIPYSGNEVEGVFILPKEGGSCREVLEKLKGEGGLENLFSSSKFESVILSIPKFNITKSFSLGSVLSDLGCQKSFSPQADFKRMMDPSNPEIPQNIQITQVVHQAMVEVSEKGTVAAAATAIMMAPKSMRMPDPAPPKIFKADRPFLFFIRHVPTGTLLFSGRVERPGV